ncbi:hypothetical protein [Vibrio parahaemolyticus]|uniref:hypothetical protein n=1 Tax=Vibrio parahaemolyticus TaxID=670 RepID=UPI00227C3B0C|nr:hypothetical protein [Vibrio parahaemolyticus]WAG36386.1 hypothetical protein JK088_24600 [Vibrio parahaemolyticus]
MRRNLAEPGETPIPQPLSSATAGGSGEVQALQRRHRGAQLQTITARSITASSP